MSEGKFEKVSRSDTPLYGPKRLLLAGFPSAARQKFQSVLQMAGLSDVPQTWISTQWGERLLSELVELPDQSGIDLPSELPRTIVAAGITEKQLIGLMTLCRKTGMKNALWATLTPTSIHWTFKALVTELQAEREALKKRK